MNVSGSIVMGLLAGWFAHKADPGQIWRLFLTTGILGGFTTFSSFSFGHGIALGAGPAFGCRVLYPHVRRALSNWNFRRPRFNLHDELGE